MNVAEVAPFNVAAVLRMLGLTRLGHATHAGYHPHLLDLAQLAIVCTAPGCLSYTRMTSALVTRSGVTV